ncbi:MAG: hypothetical protein IH864_08185 [Chloroflexi bacterium]|nr:hypothetical protein [Chloroflexota bacterium]
MTGKPLEPEDPLALVGVVLERGPDEGALTEMAWCFVEEYARMGWSGERIMRLFRNPFYRGPHQILRMKGEEFVRGLIETVDGKRSEVRSGDGG